MEGEALQIVLFILKTSLQNNCIIIFYPLQLFTATEEVIPEQAKQKDSAGPPADDDEHSQFVVEYQQVIETHHSLLVRLSPFSFPQYSSSLINIMSHSFNFSDCV